MTSPFRLTLRIGIACLLIVSATPAASAPLRIDAGNSRFDWDFPHDNELPPSADLQIPDLDWQPAPGLQDALPPDETPVESETVIQPPSPVIRSSGIRNAVGGASLSSCRCDDQGCSVVASMQPAAVATRPFHDVSDSMWSLDAASGWWPQFVHQWTGGTAIAAMPWAVVGGVALILILLSRLTRSRHESRDKPHKHARRTAAAHASTSQAQQAAIALRAKLELQPAGHSSAGASGGEELEDWIVESLNGNDAAAAAELAARDKLEERRQLESWRKLSQVASKAFILREQEEEAKQHAVWLSLVAIALGVCGLVIIATSSLGPYSLLSGVCLAVMSLVMLSWSGLKVVFHQFRRWILLRAARR
jgi:hypothetical protein